MAYRQYRQYQKTKAQFSGPSKAAILKGKTDGWIKILTPYKADFVDELKSTVQPSHRSWDPVEKVWHVHDIYLEQLIGMLKRHYDEVTQDLVVEEEVSGNMFEKLFDVITNGTAEKVHRVLSLALHPDHGGSEEMMKQLNAAWSKVKK